jgi:fructuronate reductase
LNPDILLETVCPVVASIKLGDKINVEEVLRPLLTNKAIWGVDLYEIGMVELVCGYFAEMIEGEGAVRKTLMKYV